jgi:hypothetical protein
LIRINRKQEAGELMNPHRISQVDHRAEELYEHFLRETCEWVNGGEWYEMAFAVADRFRKLIVDSQERNMMVVFDPGGREAPTAASDDEATTLDQPAAVEAYTKRNRTSPNRAVPGKSRLTCDPDD